MATKFATDGPGGPLVAGDYLRHDRSRRAALEHGIPRSTLGDGSCCLLPVCTYVVLAIANAAHQICRYTDIQADIEFIDLKPLLFITVLKTSTTELGGIT